MSGGEEKTLPPSEKKLREARKQGQVPSPGDLPIALGLAAGAGVVALAGIGMAAALQQALEAALADLAAPDPATRATTLLASLAQEGAVLAIALAAALLAARVLPTLIVHGGPVISLAPLSPKLSALDPIKGLGRVFGLRALIELAKALVRATACLAVVWIVLREGMASLVHGPACGLDCLVEATLILAALLLAGCVLVAVVVGVLDVPLQRWLFERDHKMAVSEMKRETKESFGAPELRQARQRLRNEDAGSDDLSALRHASLLVLGGGCVAALRYVRGESDVPVIVGWAKGGRLEPFLTAADPLGIPAIHDPDLARTLARGEPGRPVPRETYGGVAAALAAGGIG